MTEIGGESGQKNLHVRTCFVPFRQPVYGECVPQVMKPRLTRTRVAAQNPRKATEPPECEVYQTVAEGLMLPRLEKRMVVLTPHSRRSQVLLQGLNNITSQRDKA